MYVVWCGVASSLTKVLADIHHGFFCSTTTPMNAITIPQMAHEEVEGSKFLFDNGILSVTCTIYRV